MGNKKELAIQNLERLIAFELMQFTKETGEVVNDIYINASEDQHSGDVYYDIDLEIL